MKDHKYGMGYGLQVRYRGIADSLFVDEPFTEEFSVAVEDFGHLSFLLSKDGIRETCENEGFDLSEPIEVTITFKNSNDENELIITIQDKDHSIEKPRVTYQSTHIVNDENINQKIDSVYQRLFRSLKESANRDGVEV